MLASERTPLVAPEKGNKDGLLSTPGDEPKGTAPRFGDRRFWHLCAVGLFCIVTIGLRINTAKMAVMYDPETGRASKETVFPKPLFLAETYFLGKLLILPFVGWRPGDWPKHVYGNTAVMVVLGAIGGMLEYASVLYLPVSIVAMLRVAGLVLFTGFASAFITKKSPMSWNICGALTLVVTGACVTSVYHVHEEHYSFHAGLGLFFVLLSTVRCVSRPPVAGAPSAPPTVALSPRLPGSCLSAC